MLFTGSYHFFDYKYNIEGYTGQDYGGAAQGLYLAVSLALLLALLRALKNVSREKAHRIVGVLGVFLTLFYIGKTTWESVYDIERFGAFNTGLLPLDMCSIIMPAGILAGFGRGRIRRIASAWVAIGGLLGGLATMVQLNAFNFYPFLSFGALYSMLWHFLMVFMGLLLLTAQRGRLSFSLVGEGYLFHVLFSLVVIPVDLIFGFDFMFYRGMSGLPYLSQVGEAMAQRGLSFLIPPAMLVVYFAAFCLIFAVAALIKNRKKAAAFPAGA